MLLEGRWVDRDVRTEILDPESGAVVDTVPRADAADAERALAHAETAAETARRWPIHERMRVLRGAARLLEERSEAFAERIAREGIKTIREARREATRCADTLRLGAEEARRLHGETVPFDQAPGSERRVGAWRPEPVGIVVAITPYNDPLNLVAHKLAPALAAGNAVILKPDSRTPLSALALVEALLEAGLPEEIVQVLTGPGSEVGATLVRDPRPRTVSFTGGKETGERIARDAGLKKLSMELGSNAPAIVLPDADLDAAVAACVAGAYAAAGQNCLHVQRLLLHRDVADAFTDAFVAGARGVATGPKLDEATDMGPMIDERAARRVESMVQDAKDAGATVLTGGERSGTVVAPTVITGVPLGHPLDVDEVYGPVTVVRTFEDPSEAVARANAVEFGLQAGLFTRDLEAAFAVAEDLRYGGVVVNDSSDYRIDAMPFGGVKGSGLGREGVRYAMEAMTEPKLVCFAFPQRP